MKYLLSLSLFLTIYRSCPAQEIPLQILLGNNSTEISWFWNAGLDSLEKFQLFNFTVIGSSYNVPNSNFVEMYSIGTYFLSQSLGIATGVRIINTQFVPVAGFSFQKSKGDFFLNIIPLIQFKGTGRPFTSSAFLFLTDKLPINEKKSLFYQLAVEPSFQGKKHEFSYQSLLLGLDAHKKFQFGLGATFSQIGEKFEISTTIGPFFRVELEGK